MIKTRHELKEYLLKDSLNYWHVQTSFIQRQWQHLFTDSLNDQTLIWNYIYSLRHLEYHVNNTGFWHKLCYIFYAHRIRKLSRVTGLQIAPNTCGKGLTIWHWGTIIINSKALIGENCTMRPPITIGHTSNGETPIIGNNVTINGGVSIVGGIEIGDNVIVAPNAAVVKNIPANVIVGGVPAKVLKVLN